MKQAKTNLPSGTYLIQEVPEDADYFDILEQTKIYRKSVNKLSDSEIGNWQLLGADPTALSEVEAGEIVESWMSVFGHNRVYQNYPDAIPKCRTATVSLDSLAGSLGISKPFVVLKNVEK